MTSDNAEDRLDRLEKRLNRLEDVSAITQLVASYGPAVDGDARDLTSSLWQEDGVFDVHAPVWSGGSAMHGRAEIAAMLAGELHQSLLTQGCAHVNSPPRIEIDGDRAVVLTYQQVVACPTDGGAFMIAALSVHRWELHRTGAAEVHRGWQIADRQGRSLRNGPDRKRLLREAFAAPDEERAQQ